MKNSDMLLQMLDMLDMLLQICNTHSDQVYDSIDCSSEMIIVFLYICRYVLDICKPFQNILLQYWRNV